MKLKNKKEEGKSSKGQPAGLLQPQLQAFFFPKPALITFRGCSAWQAERTEPHPVQTPVLPRRQDGGAKVLGARRSYMSHQLDQALFPSIDPNSVFLENKIAGEGFVVKNPRAKAGDTGSIPDPGRSHMLRSN